MKRLGDDLCLELVHNQLIEAQIPKTKAAEDRFFLVPQSCHQIEINLFEYPLPKGGVDELHNNPTMIMESVIPSSRCYSDSPNSARC